jgi:hypothetical protein
MRLSQLQGVFKSLASNGGPVIDILGMDTCLMSMAEVVYEFRDCVQRFISSEGFSPDGGWSYLRVLALLAAIKPPEPSNLAADIVRHHVKNYKDHVLGGMSVDQSALNVGESYRLMFAVRTLAEALRKDLATPYKYDWGSEWHNELLLSHWETQSYSGEIFVDLYDFCDVLGSRFGRLEKTLGKTDVIPACDLVKDTLSKHLVLKSCYNGPDFQYSYGVSIYFPWYEVLPNYSALDFSKETGWDKFLNGGKDSYLAKTRRRPRHGIGELFRDTPPWNRAPDGRVYSMRNAPTQYYDSPCLKETSNTLLTSIKPED